MSHVELEIKVVPGARREVVAGWLGDALKVRVSVPPEKGKANEAVVRIVAKMLEVAPREVSIVSGHTSPRKRLVIEGLSETELRARIETHLARA